MLQSDMISVAVNEARQRIERWTSEDASVRDEIVSETLFELNRKLHQNRFVAGFSNPESLVKWLLSVAGKMRLRIRDRQYRWQQKMTQFADLDLKDPSFMVSHLRDSSIIESQCDLSVECSILQIVRQKMKDSENAILDECVVNGRGVTEVARERNLPRQTVDSMLSRAKKKLRRLFEDARHPDLDSRPGDPDRPKTQTRDPRKPPVQN